MQYLVFDDMTQCTSDEVQRLLSCVSAQRREQALKYTHTFGQFCCLKSYEMLLSLLQQSECGNTLPHFTYNQYGKPLLQGGPFFSISHCRCGIAVAIDTQPIGIDIESIRPLQNELVAKVMNTQEQCLIVASVQSSLEFTRLWTQKEAVLKLRGTGIISNLKDTLETCSDVSFLTKEDIEHQYILTIATTII